MKLILAISAVKRMGAATALAAMAALAMTGCVDKFPLPDEFDAAFVTGDVCMPSVIATGTTEAGDAPEYPVRIETCVYRCVSVDRSTVRWHYGWACRSGMCQMALLLTGHVSRVKGEKDCDARDLPDPPSSECKKEVFEYMLTPPCCMQSDDESMYATGNFVVTVPYLDMDQGEEAVSRLEKGESMTKVAEEVVGMQNYPKRQFPVNFDPANPVLSSFDDLGSETCHHIPAP